jgi:uncharacterized protein
MHTTYPSLGVGLLVNNSKKFMDYLEKLDEITETYELLLSQYMDNPDELNKMVQRLNKPIIAHTTRFSFGTDAPLEEDTLLNVKDLLDRCSAQWVGDHLGFTGVPGTEAGYLMPLIYIEEAIHSFVNRVEQAKKMINTPIIIENVIQLYNEVGNYTQASFLSEVVNKLDIGILLSIENLVMCKSLNDIYYYEFIDQLPLEKVVQIHCTIGNQKEQKEMESKHFGTVYKRQKLQYKLLEYLAKNKKLQPKAVVWQLGTETPSLPEPEELRERIYWAKELFF